MTAFRRRTTFAAPVILTVAACSSAKDKPRPEPPNPFPVTWHVTMANMKCAANELLNMKPVANAPAPNPPAPQEIECPPGMTGNISMTVARVSDGRCAVVPAGCTEAACAKPTVPCPLPPGEKLVKKLSYVWTIEKRGDKCHAEEEDHDCPPGVDCNPPAPRTFDCPPGVTEDKPLRFAELPDTTCVLVPDGCEDTACATEQIPCPAMK